MDILSVRVARRTLEADRIVSLDLAALDGASLPAYTAGAHIDVHLPGGLVRQYSLCSDPRDLATYQVAVLDDPHSRGGSRAMHMLEEGAVLQISSPRNHFPIVPARRSLLLAGGIGITPLMCMAADLHAQGAAFGLHYCSRTRQGTAFVGRLASAAFAGAVRHHFDDGPPEQRFDARQTLGSPDPDTHAYICGPQGFIAHVLAVAGELGWPDDRLHLEYFAAAPVAGGTDLAFDVRLARSGQVCRVPADRSVAEVLMSCGVALTVSCEQGVCGACLTRVLEGECDHRDLFLTAAERARNDQFTPCCSRARGPLLVLDL